MWLNAPGRISAIYHTSLIVDLGREEVERHARKERRKEWLERQDALAMEKTDCSFNVLTWTVLGIATSCCARS